MLKASIVLDKDFIVSEVDARLFGGFAEHLGRCIYGGLYEPDHPSADEDGFRTDVIQLVRDLNMPVMRYPGGNFVSGYHWLDGVGPRDQRPARLDPAWKTTETNRFGTNEFIDWCHKADAEPMLAINLGTAGPQQARDLLEYCNHPGGTYWSDLRIAHGYTEPHNVKLWCLGNEMDGPWQMGQKTATEYGRVAREAAKVMKLIDPEIELVACGSSNRGMATFGEWEADVLDECFERVDYISIHTYYGNTANDTPRFLARSDEMGWYIEEVAATADYIAAKRRSDKRIMLSFDEWNVWFHSHGDRESRGIKDWDTAPPLLEDVYTMEDALLVGGMLITLMNHADRVKIGCIAQVANVIAPIMTIPGGPAWRQTIFHPFAAASNYGRGLALRQVVDSPSHELPDRAPAPYLTSACILDESSGSVTIFAVNRSLKDEMELTVNLRAFGEMAVADWTTMHTPDLQATNTPDKPDAIRPVAADGASIVGSTLKALLPKASWNVIRLEAAQA